MKNKDFAVFILTHGRADNVVTLKTLKKYGYTGSIFLIVDDEDNQLEKYKENYGEKVLIFNKKKIGKTFDTVDNFDNYKAVVYARNACFEIAKKIGVKYFIQLDDDYTDFAFRFDENANFIYKPINNLDKVFDILLEFYKNTLFLSIAMAQTGDFIGGGNILNGLNRRKCMNSFICSIERPFNFLGRINEDVNTYVDLGSKGGLFLTIPIISLLQKATQSNTGGLTDIYLDYGTYIKSFYSVILQPSSVKVSLMGQKHKRLHHLVKWSNTVPMIISEKFKK